MTPRRGTRSAHFERGQKLYTLTKFREATRWEYQCAEPEAESRGGQVTSALNKLGAEGRELVNMTPRENIVGYMLCTKRALP